jgi:hypothetical protein
MESTPYSGASLAIPSIVSRNNRSVPEAEMRHRCCQDWGAGFGRERKTDLVSCMVVLDSLC